MGQRTYNILFHTHTVSGIVISVALYVIFFAGSFSFFRDEITNWERGHTVEILDELSIDFNSSIEELGKDYSLYGRDIELTHYYNERKVNVSLSASKDSLAIEKDKNGAFFYLDTKDKTTANYTEMYGLGEFLYRLHFFAQIPYPFGYYLSGFVAFFFLFAIFTGILVHWKKIVSNFYVFRPWAKIKTLWTDAHTALGVIGFPFQFVYAVTGAFFMLKLILVAPTSIFLYDGDQSKLYEELEYNHPVFKFENKPLQNPININTYVEKTKTEWPGFKITEVHIFNYGDTNMHLSISGNMDYTSKFNGLGYVIYKVADQSIVQQKKPLKTSSYLDGVKNTLYRLHLGDYAGYGLKIISFILGLISCFVIISGVMIWLVARNKKHIPEKRRRFNENVVRYYLAICLSMYPITALAFILVKFNPSGGMPFIYRTYFISWLLLSTFFIVKNDNNFTNKYTLLSGSILGLLVPITNGYVTGNWIWTSYTQGFSQILFVDVFWIVLSLMGLLVIIKLNKNEKVKTLVKTP
ncbi:hypothetical protein GGR42_003190 [Saonia flava]|uniref:PepSY domain-containing protein n=1 Tax=Saonia flava TaxID=523696 RepID=A0A846R7F4_9FLAO|nr:PepSY-associated TM helix domain-containing protein [Saonia flava]NJB72699.1 hypothetical protein [Saonia flava]